VGTKRRARISHAVPVEIRAWLHAVARVHAHLCSVVRLYGNPTSAGGQSLLGETYAARAARGDRTLLQDCLTLAIDELAGIREQVEAAIANTTPVAALPGTLDKVKEMAARAERGEQLFDERDGLQGQTDGPTCYG
jgi:hypothetical protein